MARQKLSIVQKKGQVTIPAEIRNRWGLKEGDYVAFTETENGVMITPGEVLAMEALDRIGEALQERGISLEEILKSGREIREELAKAEFQAKDEDQAGDSSLP